MSYEVCTKIKPGGSGRARCRDRPGEQYRTVWIITKKTSHFERGTEQ